MYAATIPPGVTAALLCIENGDHFVTHCEILYPEQTVVGEICGEGDLKIYLFIYFFIFSGGPLNSENLKYIL